MASKAFREGLAAVCRKLPGAEVSDARGGGHDAWKVGGKMFALIGAVAEGVAVKCSDVETVEMLKQAGAGESAPYLHKSWLRLPVDTDADQLKHRFVASHDLIRAKRPAAVRNGLAAPAEKD